MNIVFWFLVVLGLALVWLLCCRDFKGIGAFWLGLFDDAKKEMRDDTDDHPENDK